MKARLFGVLTVAMVLLMSAPTPAVSQQGAVKEGKELYERHCAGCHGIAGDGLGSDIKDLIVPPADFRSPKSRIKTDMELYLAIKYGVLFSPMHGWEGRLSDQEIRHVLSYIRSLAPFDPIG
ncbi:MAG: cytochrome c [Nitrospira sp.]|nr:cytochrome c [Nitrospira sp.]